jgi:hypothetical protein
MEQMTLDDLYRALGELRDAQPHLRDKAVYGEDSELGPEYGSAILGVTFDDEGTNLRITKIA